MHNLTQIRARSVVLGQAARFPKYEAQKRTARQIKGLVANPRAFADRVDLNQS